MRYPILLLSFFLLIELCSYSQSIGITGSFNTGEIKVSSNDGYFLPAKAGGYSFGLYYETPIVKIPRLSMGLGLERMGYLFTYKSSNVQLNRGKGYDLYSDLLKIPLDVNYSYNIWRSVVVGASFGLHPVIRTSSSENSRGLGYDGIDSVVSETVFFPNAVSLLVDGGVFLKFINVGRFNYTFQYGYSAGMTEVYQSKIVRYSLSDNAQSKANYSSNGSARHFRVSISYNLHRNNPNPFLQNNRSNE